MGAHVTKNISSDRICGRVYKVLLPIGILLNGGSIYKHEKYYITAFGTTPESIYSRTLESDAYDIMIQVKNIYYGINIPDVGKFQTITGTMMFNFTTQDGEIHNKVYDGVSLDSLFLPYPHYPRNSEECYIPNPKYLLEIANYHTYDNKTIPIVHQSKQDILRTFKMLLGFLELVAKKSPDNEVESERISFLNLYESFEKADDSEETIWLINKALHSMYCKLAGSECDLTNIKYEE